jgi:hypothetical protein
VFKEQNLLRTNPTQWLNRLVQFKYAEENEELVKKVNIDKFIWRIEDAINTDNDRFSTKPLEWDDGLALSASDHCFEVGSEGKKHVQGSTIKDRIKRYGSEIGPYTAQGLSFG